MGSVSRRATKWVFGSARARPGEPAIGGAAGRIGAGACISAKPAGADRRSGASAGVASGGATRTGASAELPASLRGGGLGFAGAADAAGGLETGLGPAGGFGGAAAVAGFGADAGLLAGALTAVLGAGGAFAVVGRFAFCGDVLAAAGRRLAEDGAAAFAAGFRAGAAALAGGRLATAAGLGRLAAAPRRTVGADLPTLRAPAAWRVCRLAVDFTAEAFGFGRGAGTRRVAAACLAGAAAFFALGAERAGLPAALPAEARLPDPLAGVDAFMPATSPSSTSRERGAQPTRLRVSPEILEPAIPRTAEHEPAWPSS